MSVSERALPPLVAWLCAACAAAPMASAAAPVAPPAPARIAVPEGLARRSATLEPSGVVWAAALDRYLIVSDDTGQAGDHHQPWVLAMSATGAFDETPVPLLGVDALNDAESICAGPGGRFFLTTSHSLDKRGRERTARDMLLLLGLEGRALRVLGRVDLTTARAADGAGSLLSIAGLPPDGRLDIEAITYRDGALLVGLKSPLTAAGGAVVLRLAAPVEALRAGRLPPGAVTRRWELPLRGDAGAVPEGIADLTSLPDGRLAVLANSPKGREKDGGGSLYWYAPATGAVTFVHQWPGLHPEGVTLAKDGREIVIVFDTNTGPPLWTRWPLPAPGAK
jgi:hypothetical protein